METRKRTVTVGDGDDGADLHVEERGSGEALLLLHGHTGTSGDWQHLFDLDDLARRYRVVIRRRSEAVLRPVNVIRRGSTEAAARRERLASSLPA